MSPISPSLIASKSQSLAPRIITISETIWRTAASNHSQRIKSILQPGLTPLDHVLNSGRKYRGNRRHIVDEWTALDPTNPIYNFLVEYYGLKGAKGPRRLARWAPDLKLLRGADTIVGDDASSSVHHTTVTQSDSSVDVVYKAAMKASHGLGGILLENANLDDLGGTLYLRGSVPVPMEESDSMLQSSIQSTTANTDDNDDPEQQLHGILYNPAVFYDRHLPIEEDDIERRKKLRKTIAPFQWYSSILQTTMESEPILHCYGLHEWAMQYHPEGSPPPPSAKYQSSLKLRVSREVINEAVERKGIRCTHVDALRFFAPAAGPLNHHGHELERMDQLRLEQKGCVHAHMDLLKIGLKLHGFISSELLLEILELSLAARQLDVEASPYDATEYGARIVPVETNEGRKMYRDEQIVLMQRSEPIRRRLLDAYEVFMKLAFEEDVLGGDSSDKNIAEDTSNTEGPYIAPERLATARPG
eukprot:CAMPEP_0172319884 /NCGR_PEP_ID=MMETSP1058-20130122/38971_1 /TAXON_ID=83371 /ORGANISM="Detonula confervacea, Strain CCMP 353" /LENGTH=473 /DNA_ID=CAMNT_0013035029 /DNA_START=129 /DNA_END=1547 /DNA_ORIENTATION=-